MNKDEKKKPCGHLIKHASYMYESEKEQHGNSRRWVN
jgi:hypothetical protein